MKFFRRTARHTLLDNRRNEGILGDWKAEPVYKKLSRNK